MKDRNKHITAIDAPAVGPLSSWLSLSPSKWKRALLSIVVFLALFLFGYCLTFSLCQTGARATHTSVEMPSLDFKRDSRNEVLLPCQSLPFQNPYVTPGHQEVVTEGMTVVPSPSIGMERCFESGDLKEDINYLHFDFSLYF